MSPSIGIQLLKWSIVLLLAGEIVGGALLLYLSPVHRYTISCEKMQQISCLLEQERSSGRESWQVSLGTSALAIVQVKQLRRSGPQVLLYIQSDNNSVFAAQFVGGDEVGNAQTAATRLNQTFSSTGPASAHVEARSPSYLTWGTWIGFGTFVLLSLAVFRQLFKPERRPTDSSKPTPLRSAP